MNRILLFVLISALFACHSRETKQTQSNAVQPEAGQPNATKDLPSMQVRLMNGTIVDMKAITGKTVLILFQPDCDHCQHEAEDFRLHLADFNDQTLYFVSSSPMEQIVQFSKDYKLADNARVIFAWTTTENILTNFGPIAAPSIYIYSAEGKLIQKFNGQTPVEEILKYL